ncbi:MAG: hypothetical protein ACO3GH_05275 [Ilumatobacteraceae bacterium]
MARAKWAEDLVAAWYVREGYDIVARNWPLRCSVVVSRCAKRRFSQ